MFQALVMLVPGGREAPTEVHAQGRGCKASPRSLLLEVSTAVAVLPRAQEGPCFHLCPLQGPGQGGRRSQKSGPARALASLVEAAREPVEAQSFLASSQTPGASLMTG